MTFVLYTFEQSEMLHGKKKIAFIGFVSFLSGSIFPQNLQYCDIKYTSVSDYFTA